MNLRQMLSYIVRLTSLRPDSPRRYRGLVTTSTTSREEPKLKLTSQISFATHAFSKRVSRVKIKPALMPYTVLRTFLLIALLTSHPETYPQL
jgi:hypothetical protein